MGDIIEKSRQLDLDILLLSDPTIITNLTSIIDTIDAEYKLTRANDISTLTSQCERLKIFIEGVNESIGTLQERVTKMSQSQATVRRTLLSMEQNDIELESQDLTTQKLMMDFANEYKLLYMLFWVKIAIGVVLIYFLYTPFNALLLIGTFVTLILLFYLYAFFQEAVSSTLSLNSGKELIGSTVIKEDCPPPVVYCPDGVTVANADKSNCTALPEYCADGVTVANADKSNCEAVIPLPQYCEDGVTVANADRSNCVTDFGYCPDGFMAKVDVLGTNCLTLEEVMGLQWWQQWWFTLIICVFAFVGLAFISFRVFNDGAAIFWFYDDEEIWKKPYILLIVFAVVGTCIDFLIYRYYSIGGDGNGKGAIPVEEVPWFKTMWFFFIVTMVCIYLLFQQQNTFKKQSSDYARLKTEGRIGGRIDDA